MALGAAKLTATTQRFLDTCEAVKWWNELPGDDSVMFEFDELAEVHGKIPAGVFFDDGDPNMPADLRDAIAQWNDDDMHGKHDKSLISE